MGGRRAVRGVAVLVLYASGCERSPAPPPIADGDRAFGHLQAQVACGPRVPGTPGAACGRRLILDHLARFAPRVTTQEFSLPDPYGPDSLRLVNLQASFFVDLPARVLLGAHYDTRPRADQDSGNARELPIAGANDGASGVAVLLEVAQQLGGWDPGVGVDLVFFDGEDYGREGDLDHYLLGSRYFVRNRGAYHPLAMILVDMVGKRDLRIPVEEYSQRLAPQLVDLVFGVADSLGVSAFVREPGRPVVDDHVPFLQAGIPALDLIDFDDPAWHTQADLPDRCSPESLAGVTTVLLHSLARFGAR